jgi:hypothetical protein
MRREIPKTSVFEINGEKISAEELELAASKVLADRKTITKWDRRKAERRVSDRMRRTREKL